MRQVNYKSISLTIIVIFILAYTIFKSLNMGADSNVYLYASKQIFKGENIYERGPFNDYLYSPFFAILLRPLSILNLGAGRVIWGLINLVLIYRLGVILFKIVKENFELTNKIQKIWLAGIVLISAGFLNHNIILGQITIVILWLTFEGLYQVFAKQNHLVGGLLLALGVIIKIIPILGLYYLFFKKKFKATAYSVCFSILFIFLPSLIIGHDYNTFLLENWWETINPTGESKYVFENNSGTQSLNALFPAYFYNFNGSITPHIASLSYNTLAIFLQITRVLFVLSFLLLIVYNRKNRKNKLLYFWWEFSYLALVTVLIFPHQQKYAMLYYVPAGAYLLLFIILSKESKYRLNSYQKTIAIASICMMFVSTFSARDIVGVTISKTIDNYHWFGLVNIIFMLFLYIIKPKLLVKLNTQSK